MFRIIFLLLLFSCDDGYLSYDSVPLIENLIVDIDRTNDELYIQVEISQSTIGSRDSLYMDSVKVNLEYVGGVGINYNNDFLLYDNGENGDLIANNGVFTLVDEVSKIDTPDEQAEIINVSLPDYYRVDDLESGEIPFSVTIKGKKYLATVTLFERGSIYTLEKYINIDNTSLEIQINKSQLYIDNPGTEICDRISDTYEDIFYPISWDWPEATSDGMNDYFTYDSKFSVASMDECASTGTSIFKFILNDLDTNVSDSEEKSIIIFGCGDNICESNYESISSCPEDCTNE